MAMHDGNWTLVRGDIQQSHISKCAKLSCGHAVLDYLDTPRGRETLAVGDKLYCPSVGCGSVDAGGAVDLSVMPAPVSVESISDSGALAHLRAIGAAQEGR